MFSGTSPYRHDPHTRPQRGETGADASKLDGAVWLTWTRVHRDPSINPLDCVCLVCVSVHVYVWLWVNVHLYVYVRLFLRVCTVALQCASMQNEASGERLASCVQVHMENTDRQIYRTFYACCRSPSRSKPTGRTSYEHGARRRKSETREHTVMNRLRNASLSVSGETRKKSFSGTRVSVQLCEDLLRPTPWLFGQLHP